MLRRALAAVALLVGAASLASAQAVAGARCDMVNTGETRSTAYKLPSGEFNVFMGAGVLMRCPSKGITIRADSLEYYGDERRVYLVGNASYDEPRFVVTSQYLTYWMQLERIVAVQNVKARLPSGSTLEGPQVEYLRAVPRIRTRAQLTAISRPTVKIVQKDSLGRPAPPMNVTANTIFMDGDSLVYASGRVDILRDSLKAHGDSAFLDAGRETMRMMRGPVIEGRADRPFRLAGELIDLFARQRKLQRVISRGSAVATSQDMTLRSDTIDLRVSDDLLQRAVAWGPKRAFANSAAQNLAADSIDVVMPGQRVREVRALRAAFAEGRPDSTRFKADTTDWMRGDTIVAAFDTLARTATKRDSAKGPDIQRLIAIGKASSYYHLAASDTTAHRPAISYVRGTQITVAFDTGRVATVRVVGQATGVYAEPIADTTARRGAATTRPAGAQPAPGRGTGLPTRPTAPQTPPRTTTPPATRPQTRPPAPETPKR